MKAILIVLLFFISVLHFSCENGKEPAEEEVFSKSDSLKKVLKDTISSPDSNEEKIESAEKDTLPQKAVFEIEEKNKAFEALIFIYSPRDMSQDLVSKMNRLAQLALSNDMVLAYVDGPDCRTVPLVIDGQLVGYIHTENPASGQPQVVLKSYQKEAAHYFLKDMTWENAQSYFSSLPKDSILSES